MTETRPAATVLLLRDGGAGLEVFMVRRHHMMGFAGDAVVFPGGRIDATDHALALRTDLVPREAAGDEGGDTGAIASRIGALRETFEESGILLARRDGQLVDGSFTTAVSSSRGLIAGGILSFESFLRQERLVLATDLLVPFAHWITPPVFPKRYDTHFYLAAAPVDQIPIHDGRESTDSFWITPQDVLAGKTAGRLEFVTRRNLEKLSASRTVADAIRTARAGRIVTVSPDIEDTAQGRVARLPLEAGYGGPCFDFAQ